jgi:hypothetical protein
MVNYQHGPLDDSVKEYNGDNVQRYDPESIYTKDEQKTRKREEEEKKVKQEKAKNDMITALKIMELDQNKTPKDQLVVTVLRYDLYNTNTYTNKKSDIFISDYWANFMQYRSDRFEKEGEYTNENWWKRWDLDKSIGTIFDKNGKPIRDENGKKKEISLRDLIISHFKAKYADKLKTEGGKRRKTSRRTRKPRRKSSRRLRRKSRRQRKR